MSVQRCSSIQKDGGNVESPETGAEGQRKMEKHGKTICYQQTDRVANGLNAGETNQGRAGKKGWREQNKVRGCEVRPRV